MLQTVSGQLCKIMDYSAQVSDQQSALGLQIARCWAKGMNQWEQRFTNLQLGRRKPKTGKYELFCRTETR